MGFSDKQVRALCRGVANDRIRIRKLDGRELRYIEGWHAIAEANRIFGFDGWDRETLEARCIVAREVRGAFTAIYMAKVRITVRAGGLTVVREGSGTGEAKGSSLGEAHEIAIKASETDATKRALATFGRPFGLALYHTARPRPVSAQESAHPQEVASPAPHEVASAVEVQPSASATPALPDTVAPSKIDKSVLAFGEPRRERDKDHLRFVASQPCLICSRTPSDAHHLRFAQSRALGRKVGDQFTVPLCRTHHRQVHECRDEGAWWSDLEVNAMEIAGGLWEQSRMKRVESVRRLPSSNDSINASDVTPSLP